jgi:hypothetical protein
MRSDTDYGNPDESVMPPLTNAYRDRIALAFLVAVNLIPIAGVLWLDWDLASIIILYWLENLVIGFYTILKMLHLQGLGALFPAAFFCLHYGAFCGVHGIFVLTLTGGDGLGGQLFPSGEDSWPAHLVFIQMLVRAVQHILDTAAPGVLLAWLGLFLSHGLSLLLNYFQGGEYRTSEVKSLMSAPYKRIAVLHVAIIAGAWGINALGSPLVLLVALVIVKIVLDIQLHRKAHREHG